MKTKILSLLVLFSIVFTSGFAQEKTKKELKAERLLEKQKLTEALINARDFVFVGHRALPTGMRSVDLISNPNFVKFQPEMIESEMPFFGRAYSGVGYGGDSGLRFKGKPEEFTVVKNKKDYQIDVVVNGTTDKFTLYLSVGFDGSASLSISSNSRSSISYQGEISAPKVEEKK